MTIHEIARLAGVSSATVSRVFNRREGIGEEIRSRVLATAQKYGYWPKMSAKQKNIVILLPDSGVYPVQSCVDMLLMAISGVLPEHGFRIEILPVNNLERLERIQFCGAVAIGLEPSRFADWESRFAVPLVLVDRNSARRMRGVYLVRSDEAQGMELAIGHLSKHRCRRIGSIIHGEAGLGNSSERREAILAALRKFDLPHDDSLVCFAGTGTGKYVELIGKMLKNKVDGLFCPGGNAGILALYAFSLFGRNVPEDISLIASEQSFFSEFAVPPQTTVTQDYGAVAREVVRVLESAATGAATEWKTTLPYLLISRESVRI